MISCAVKRRTMLRISDCSSSRSNLMTCSSVTYGPICYRGNIWETVSARAKRKSRPWIGESGALQGTGIEDRNLHHLLPACRRQICFLQLRYRLVILKFLWGYPAHLGGLPVQSNSIRGKHLEEERVDIPVPVDSSIFVLYDRAAPEQPYLFALQACLLTNLGKGLLVGRYPCFNETANAGPALIITSHTLAATHNQYARLSRIGSQEKAGDNMRLAQRLLRMFRRLVLTHSIAP